MNTAHTKLYVGPSVLSECHDITIDGSGMCYVF